MELTDLEVDMRVSTNLFLELMTGNKDKENVSVFKYQRRMTLSRQTLWRRNRDAQALRDSNEGSKQITSYFPPVNLQASDDISISSPFDEPIAALERILKLKTDRPSG